MVVAVIFRARPPYDGQTVDEIDNLVKFYNVEEAFKVFNLEMITFEEIFDQNTNFTRVVLIGLPWDIDKLPSELQKAVHLFPVPFARIPKDVSNTDEMKDTRLAQFREQFKWHLVDKTITVLTAELDFKKEVAVTKVIAKPKPKPKAKPIMQLYKEDRTLSQWIVKKKV